MSTDTARPPTVPDAITYIGVDTGGTFTDAVMITESGSVHLDKAFSTPDNPALGVVQALQNCAETAGLNLLDVLRSTSRFAHGTTVGTNALIQRKGARVGLLMTSGFEDTVLIGRGPLGKNLGVTPSEAMDFAHQERPVPLVSKAMTRGVVERIDRRGDVVTALDRDGLRTAVRELMEQGATSLAVCFLWSFRNPEHELAAREVIQEDFPDVLISLSCEVSPVLGEFERATTTIVNAYLGPILSSYVADLGDRLADSGFRSDIQIMKSSGGVTVPARMTKDAASLVNSGPVGGLAAARHLGDVMGYENVITADMGGTSFDVGLIRQGDFEYERTPVAGPGIPLQLPAAKVVAIGAGGGSVAWTDGRRLRVGPQSAGSRPGPACYGEGGTEPTVTDALVVLGLLNPSNFFGGRKDLDVTAAEQAIRVRVADPLGLELREAAAGIIEIVTAHMGDLVRQITVESGYDPRNFVLFSYGGAGPIHAAMYAQSLGIGEVVIPYSSAVFSALGCAVSDARYSFAKSHPMALTDATEGPGAFREVFETLREQARAELGQDVGADDASQLEYSVDVRYEGQMSELNIASSPADASPDGFQALKARFEDTYESRYGAGTSRSSSTIESVTFRLDVTVPTVAPTLHRAPGSVTSRAHEGRKRQIFLRGHGELTAGVLLASDLTAGLTVEGPIVIERVDTTIFVPPGSTLSVDDAGNCRIKVGASL